MAHLHTRFARSAIAALILASALIAGALIGASPTAGSAFPGLNGMIAFASSRDGKVSRGREYATREQALEAAGLSD